MKNSGKKEQEHLSFPFTFSVPLGSTWARPVSRKGCQHREQVSLNLPTCRWEVGNSDINFTFPTCYPVRRVRDLVSRCRPPCNPAVHSSMALSALVEKAALPGTAASRNWTENSLRFHVNLWAVT